jgi:cation diffusion facilitator family transporter
MVKNVSMQRLKTRAALLSIASNTILITLKLVVGIMMHSVSVISEAVHSGLDLVAALIAFFSIRESGKPPDDKHRYGHGKIESVAGTIEAILIFAAAAYIIFEAGRKLHARHLFIEELDIGALVMGISAVANFFVSRYLMKVSKRTDSIALEADAMHLQTDVYTSVGVLVGLVAIKFTGMAILDPIIAIGIALLIIKASYDLTRTAMANVLDVRLPDEEQRVIHEVLDQNGNYFVEYHKLRTRKSGNVRYIDMHLVISKTTSLEESHDLSHSIADKIRKKLPYSEVLVHIEPCNGDCNNCGIVCSSAATQTGWRQVFLEKISKICGDRSSAFMPPGSSQNQKAPRKMISSCASMTVPVSLIP